MTILYKPVLIETEEQAKALPKGTIVTGTRFGVIEKANHGRWWVGTHQLPDHVAVGCQALVPIEAEEEDEYNVFDIPHEGKIPGAARYHRHVYTTAWEIG